MPDPAVNPEEWERIHDEEIAPRMDEIVRICQEHGIPCSIIFQLTAGEPATYCTTQLPTGAAERFQRWMNRWQHDIADLRPMSEWREGY